MSGRTTTQGLSADRTGLWRGVGFNLSAALDGLTLQFLDVLSYLAFQMAQVLITGQHAALGRFFQRTGGSCRKHR